MRTGSVVAGRPIPPFIIRADRRIRCHRPFEIAWTIDQASDETFHTLPLLGRSKGTCSAFCSWAVRSGKMVTLDRRIRWTRFRRCSASACSSGLMLSWWGAARVTRPVQKLAEGAREVSEGNWNTRVDVRGPSESQPALQIASISMTEQLERTARASDSSRTRRRLARSRRADSRTNSKIRSSRCRPPSKICSSAPEK